MTWLFVLIAWTVCAVVAAPVVGRVLAYGGLVDQPVHRRPVPTPRNPLVLR